MARPLIGVTGRRRFGRDIRGFATAVHDVEVDLYVSSYAAAVLEAGGLPVHLPQDGQARWYLDQVDALLLTGGADIDPRRYGAEPAAEVQTPELCRDDFEFALVDAALRQGVTVLGICRGMQILNVVSGGTLHQDVPFHLQEELPGSSLVDEIEIEPGTILHGLYGTRLKVNSLHHQTIDVVGRGCVVSARSVDGTIEAIELPTCGALGVQWHPELLSTRDADPLFRWLVDRARVRQV